MELLSLSFSPPPPRPENGSSGRISPSYCKTAISTAMEVEEGRVLSSPEGRDSLHVRPLLPAAETCRAWSRFRLIVTGMQPVFALTVNSTKLMLRDIPTKVRQKQTMRRHSITYVCQCTLHGSLSTRYPWLSLCCDCY